MSPTSLRVFAGAAAALLALFTAIVVGFVGGSDTCAPGPGPEPGNSVSQGTSPAPTPTGGSATLVPGGPGPDRTGQAVSPLTSQPVQIRPRRVALEADC